MATTLVDNIKSHINSPQWLDENVQNMYDVLRDHLRDQGNLDEVVEALLYILPELAGRDDLRRWGRLLEQVYNRSEFAKYNGLDGEHVDPSLQFYILQKRPKVQQLPTKTVRRKRLMLHPSQMFEIYMIFFMATFYPKANEITQDQIESLLKLARMINDVYGINKLNQAIAFVYNTQNRFEQSLLPAHTSYAYWRQNNNNLEAGISAYALGVAYQQLEELDKAQDWYTRSGEHFSKTGYRRQYGAVSLGTASLKLSREEYEAALQWANIAVEEYHPLGLKLQVAVAKHTRGIAHIYLGNFDDALEDLEDAQRYYKETGNTQSLHQIEYHYALRSAKMGNDQEALKRLKKMTDDINKSSNEAYRAVMSARVADLVKLIQTGKV